MKFQGVHSASWWGFAKLAGFGVKESHTQGNEHTLDGTSRKLVGGQSCVSH